MSLHEAASSGSFNPHAAPATDPQRVESPFDPPLVDHAFDQAFDGTADEAPSPFTQSYDDAVETDGAIGEEEPDMRATRRRAWTVLGLAVIVPAAVAGIVAWQLFGSSSDPAPTVTRVTTTPAEIATPVVEVTSATTVAASSATTDTSATSTDASTTATVAASTEATAAEPTVATAAPTFDLSSLEPAERLAAWTQVETIDVLPGETLWLIAQNYGTTISAIVTLNGLTDPETLSIGQQLMIPVNFAEEIEVATVAVSEVAETAVTGGSESSATVAETPTVAPEVTEDLANWHTIAVISVADGDSLAGIADANTTTVEAIMALNGLADPNLIFVGDALLVPVGFQGDTAVVDVEISTTGEGTSSDDMLEEKSVSSTTGTENDDLLQE